jgi:predicted nucleic acid-binding Zn ribbon protein
MELMPLYRHECRECEKVWDEEYTLKMYDILKLACTPLACPDCGGADTFRQVTTSGCVIFKGGGWSPEGYNKHTCYDSYDNVEIFDRKEDHDRVVKGEARQAELAKQKKLDAASKRCFGADAGVKQDEADAAIKKAGDDAVE